MTMLESIRLTDLLLERESEFVRIAECERLIQGILGQPYPFTPPPPLPSLAKRRPPRRPRKGEEAGGAAAVALRPLRERENAYRVTWRQGEEAEVSFQADRALVQRLLALREPEFTVMEVAAVQVASPAEVTVHEVLFVRPAEGEGDAGSAAD
ncbi:MAG: hypothetical protein WC789_12635 [Lentisphaeria bacterium]|jgi:hypothetical protein